MKRPPSNANSPQSRRSPTNQVEPTNPHFWEHIEEGGRILAREAQARAVKDCVRTGALARPASAASVPAAAATTPAAPTQAHTYPNKPHSEPVPAPNMPR
jgi:hypothetical protein